MDSKLVVEQMAGNWKIKHPVDEAARRSRPTGSRRSARRSPGCRGRENAHADRLANEALDGARRERTRSVVDERRDERRGAEESRSAAGGRRSGKPDHAGPGPARRHRPHRGQALLRRAGQQQPAAQRRGSRAGPGDGGVAGAAGRRRSTRWSARRCGVRARPRRSWPSSSTSRSRRSRHRGDGVRLLGRDELHRGAREVPRRVSSLARRPRVRRRTAASRSAPWRSGCSRAATGSWRRTPGKTVVVVSHVTPIKTLVADALGAPLEAVYRMELAPASVTVISYFLGGRDGDIPMANLRLFNGADPTRGVTVGARRRSASARARSTTTSSCWPCRPGAPSSTFQPRSRDARRRARPGWAGSAPSLEQGAHQAALGGLVEVADHLALAADLVQHPHRGDRGREVGAGPPERGVRRGAQVDHQPGAGRLARPTGSSTSRQCAGDDAEAGEVDAAGEPVRRDPVARPDQPEQRRGDRQPARGAAPGGGVEGGEVERVVEDAGVDRVGAGGGRGRAGRRCGVRRRPGWDRARAPARRASGSSRHSRRARRAPARGRAVSAGKPRAAEVERLAPPRRGLALGGGQQDQHGGHA